jgi:hypothetical protein
MHHFTARLLVLLLLVSAAETALPADALASADPFANFSRFKTFNFVEEPATDGRDYRSLETTYLRTAVTYELTDRGLILGDQPDIVVNFSIETRETLSSRTTPGVRYAPGRVPYSGVYGAGWGMTHQTRIDQYTEGRLNIDLIDPAARLLIWQGSTQKVLTERDYQNTKKTLTRAVMEIFSGFPIAPVDDLVWPE